MTAATETGWQDRHPFKVGQTVYAREAHVLGSFGMFLTPGQAYRVRMRGEDAHGLWLAVDGVTEHLPERLFSAAAYAAEEVA